MESKPKKPRYDNPKEQTTTNSQNGPRSATDSVELFRQFLRIRTVSGEGPQGSYEEAFAWIEKTFREEPHLGLKTTRIDPEGIAHKPTAVVFWPGSNPSLSAILLNSHYDVVPAMEDLWDPKYPPFEANRSDDGFIYGRGAQDMKCVCIQYIVAIRELRRQGFVPERNVYLSFVPDEEIGGGDGMARFLQCEQFSTYNIGLALDEGLANPSDKFTVFWGERTPWWIIVTAKGPTGHGSRFIKDTAVEKLLGVTSKALNFRREQEALLDGHGCKHCAAKKLGDVTTLNITMLNAGVSSDSGKTYAINVIPTEVKAGFDIRITPNTMTEEIKRMLDEWCAGEGLSWEFASWTKPLHDHYVTSTNSEENPWWKIFSSTLERLGISIEKEIFPAATDSRFVRQLGIPAFGFSPMRNTEILLHEHNERLHEDTFREGVDVYVDIIRDLSSSNMETKLLK